MKALQTLVLALHRRMCHPWSVRLVKTLTWSVLGVAWVLYLFGHS